MSFLVQASLPGSAARWDVPQRRVGGECGFAARSELTSIVTAQSGAPFTPTINTDPANTGTSKRPNRIGSSVLDHPTLNESFDKLGLRPFKNSRFRRAESAYVESLTEFFNCFQHSAF